MTNLKEFSDFILGVYRNKGIFCYYHGTSMELCSMELCNVAQYPMYLTYENFKTGKIKIGNKTPLSLEDINPNTVFRPAS